MGWSERRWRKKAERQRRKQAPRIAYGQRLATGQDLGQLRDIFRLHHTSWWWGPALVLLSVLLLFGIPGFLAYVNWVGHRTGGVRGIIGLSLVVSGWVIWIFLLRRTGRDRDPGHDEWIYSCDAGFVHVRDQARATRVIRWDQVVAVHRPWVKVEPSEGDPYFLPDGHLLVLDDGAHLPLAGRYQNALDPWGSGVHSGFEPWFPFLGDVVERAVTDRLLPPAMAAYERGEVVWFGPVGVGRQGITVAPAQEMLAWTEFGGLAQVGHALVLWRRPGSQPLRPSALKELLHDAGVWMGRLDVVMETRSAGRQRARPGDTWQILDVGSIPNLCVLEAMLARLEAGGGTTPA